MLLFLGAESNSPTVSVLFKGLNGVSIFYAGYFLSISTFSIRNGTYLGYSAILY